MTLEQFEHFILLPENAGRNFELVAGEIGEVVSNNQSSRLGMRLGARLTVFAEDQDLGWVTGADGGYVVAGERYIPDVAFVSKARQPRPSRETYNPLAPDLAVEVLSPSDDRDKLRIKIVNYLLAGTMVWVVDPDRQQVEIYAPGESPQKLGLDDTLEGGRVLPGFRLTARTLFAE